MQGQRSWTRGHQAKIVDTFQKPIKVKYKTLQEICLQKGFSVNLSGTAEGEEMVGL